MVTLTQANNLITIENRRFHYIWLRENCPSCRYAAPYQQLSDPNISDRPENPQPLRIELNQGNLIIDWDETPSHRSVFPIEWLLQNSYDPQLYPATYSCPKNDSYTLWHRMQLQLHPPQTYDVEEITDNTLWFEQLFKLGFVVLENISPNQLQSFMASIGPIYNVDYGQIFALETKAKDQQKILPKDGCALPPHNDLSYLGNHRLIQFLYCLESHNQGGESILVDGFRVAQDFRQAHPHDFELLQKTLVQFWLVDPHHQYQFCNLAPIVECDHKSNLSTIRFSKRNCRPHLPFEQLEDFYQAYRLFFQYLKNSDYQYQFPLKSHSCVLFQNFRILHGRTAFNPEIGNRKLKAGYIDWNFFLGRKNFSYR
jgi:alpha-ketoglutarate-dependent taurine dioxygenase